MRQAGRWPGKQQRRGLGTGFQAWTDFNLRGVALNARVVEGKHDEEVKAGCE